MSGIFEKLIERRKRTDLYSCREYWDRHVVKALGTTLMMWPNEILSGLLHEEETLYLSRYLPDITGCTVLDLGCGGGRLTRYCAERGAHVTAVDYSTESVLATRTASIGYDVKTEICNLFELSSVDEYEVVLSSGLLAVGCSNKSELKSALLIMYNALKPGGHLVLFEPLHKGFLRRVLPLSALEVLTTAEAVGLRVVRVQPMLFAPVRLTLSEFSQVPDACTTYAYNMGRYLINSCGLGLMADYTAAILQKKC